MITGETATEVERAFARLAPALVSLAAAAIGSVDDLYPEEAVLVAGAIPRRRWEFAAGRWCARRALLKAGGPAGPILRGPFWGPVWPSGFDGSITHDGGVAVAAACRIGDDGDGRVGVDLLDRSDPARFDDIASVILSRLDRSVLGPDISNPSVLAEAFSAKEAAIKILSSEVGLFIEFADVGIAPEAGGFALTHPATDLRIVSRSRPCGAFLVTVATSHRPRSGDRRSGSDPGGRQLGAEPAGLSVSPRSRSR